MTLRLRLGLLLVALVAAGLLISDVVTYNALRSFLTTRVDQQLEVAAFPVDRALLSSSGLGPQVPAAPPAAGTSGTPSTLPPGVTVAPGRIVRGDAGRVDSRDVFRNGGGLVGSGRSPDRAVLVPPGVYGELRSASGKVEAHLFFSYGGKAPSAPAIPARLPGSGLPAGADLYFTTASSGAGGVGYRAVAKPLLGGRGVVVIAEPLTDLESTLRHLLLVELVVSAAILAGLGLLAWAMVRRDLRPLEAMTATAGRIAEGDLTQRVEVTGKGTEVGQLGAAFNTMVDGIEEAFAERTASEERLRRFLADASHELRTPLTSILGYAELFDLGVRDRPADLATSMRNIKDEAARMRVLVDDLFLLAQLDHERPLALEHVDLADVVHRAVGALAVTAPDRPVDVDAPSPVRVLGDAPRLRQVVDNLLANARTHTPAGSPVEITVRSEQGAGVVRVHDHGEGVDPADAARIFEPFTRADRSRARSSGGAGLGLAIVAAIVKAHGGTVAVEPGPGGTFVVRIPLDGSAPAAGADGPGAGDRSAGDQAGSWGEEAVLRQEAAPLPAGHDGIEVGSS